MKNTFNVLIFKYHKYLVNFNSFEQNSFNIYFLMILIYKILNFKKENEKPFSNFF